MFVEFDTFDDFVCAHVDFIKDIAAYYGIDSLVLSWFDAVDCSTGFVNSLWLAILNKYIYTEMFQVLIVPSCDPLTSTLLKTKRFETLFV